MDRIMDVVRREEFRDGAGPSTAPQGFGISPLSEYELEKRRLRDRLQQIYISAYILKRINRCPDTRCIAYDPIWDLVEHLLEVHYDAPNALIDLENHYSIPIEVHKLQLGKSQTVAVLLIPIVNMREYDTASDRTTMPLIMLAAKIHPFKNFECRQSFPAVTSTTLTSTASTSAASTSTASTSTASKSAASKSAASKSAASKSAASTSTALTYAASTSAASTAAASTSTALTYAAATAGASTSAASTSTVATKPINDGDMIMIWICGHVPTISSVIKISSSVENQIHLFRGYIHSIADTNTNPNIVFSRGNCLLVPAHNITALTHECKIPLDVEITLKIKEEDLI